MTFAWNHVTMQYIPFVGFGVSTFLRIMIGIPIFSLRMYNRMPEISMVLSSLIEYVTTSSLVPALSTDLYIFTSPGNSPMSPLFCWLIFHSVVRVWLTSQPFRPGPIGCQDWVHLDLEFLKVGHNLTQSCKDCDSVYKVNSQ